MLVVTAPGPFGKTQRRRGDPMSSRSPTDAAETTALKALKDKIAKLPPADAFYAKTCSDHLLLVRLGVYTAG